MMVSTSEHGLLRKEAIAIAKYLTEREPEEFVIDRYISGGNAKFGIITETKDQKLQLFIVEHPSTLPCIDAACAVLFPKLQLRNKILLMVAILETTPEYCDFFFPSPFNKSLFFLKTLGYLLK